MKLKVVASFLAPTEAGMGELKIGESLADFFLFVWCLGGGDFGFQIGDAVVQIGELFCEPLGDVTVVLGIPGV